MCSAFKPLSSKIPNRALLNVFQMTRALLSRACKPIPKTPKLQPIATSPNQPIQLNSTEWNPTQPSCGNYIIIYLRDEVRVVRRINAWYYTWIFMCTTLDTTGYIYIYSTPIYRMGMQQSRQTERTRINLYILYIDIYICIHIYRITKDRRTM